MRKWFYAGAVAGGFLLLGAAPAQADVVPVPVGGVLSAVGSGVQGAGLNPAGGLNLESPLGGSPLVKVKPGQNSPDLTSAASSLTDPAPESAAELPADRTPAAGRGPGDLPIGNLTNIVPGGLLGGGLLGGGLLPDGRVPAAEAPRESALFDGGLPLLGGLGGLLPANEAPQTPPATPAVSSMPAGGTAVDQPVRDPRVHEEPNDGRKRSFSDGGRPVAGEDTEFS